MTLTLPHGMNLKKDGLQVLKPGLACRALAHELVTPEACLLQCGSVRVSDVPPMMISNQSHLTLMKAEQMFEKAGADRFLELHVLRQSIQIVIAHRLHRQSPARGWVRVLPSKLKFEKIREFFVDQERTAHIGVKHIFLEHVIEVLFCGVPSTNGVQQKASGVFACVVVLDAMHKPTQAGH